MLDLRSTVKVSRIVVVTQLWSRKHKQMKIVQIACKTLNTFMY